MPVAEAVEDVDQLLDAVSTDVVCMFLSGCRRHANNGERVRIKAGRKRVYQSSQVLGFAVVFLIESSSSTDAG